MLQVQKLADVSVLKGDIAKQEDVLNVMQQARGEVSGWDGKEVVEFYGFVEKWGSEHPQNGKIDWEHDK